ncbi:hypothetical protein SOVF_176920, partial [Spinacia oleracea]
MGLAFI